MTVFANSGGCYLAGKQVFPMDYQSEVSQRLIDAVHANDIKLTSDCISDPFVDVNFVGTVCLKARRTELVLYDEAATQVVVGFDEFKTEVTALFLAAYSGNALFVRKLLTVGANVNHKLFRGYATTAAVREGHIETLEMLLTAGAAQPACEEALLEASYLGRARAAELLMGSDMIRPHVAVHALVIASCRGFVDFVHTLIKYGVDINATARVLLQSSKPSLHANVDCNALIAAVVNRQTSVLQLLLQVGARTDTKVRLGAWSWDIATAEEFRVGAGLAEPYGVTWCAVEYFEASGAILRMLLRYLSPNIPHLGRTIMHHAILCSNARALGVLLNCGAGVELAVETTKPTEIHPIHMAARLGHAGVLQSLINYGCNLNSKTESGETALMISTRYKHKECLKVLASAGADFGLVNLAGLGVKSIAEFSQWRLGFQQVILDLIRAGKDVRSSCAKTFSSLIFATQANDIEALRKLTKQPNIEIDEQDEDGMSAVMIAASNGHVDAFQLLVYAGADVRLQNKNGETAISLSDLHQNIDALEKVMLEYSLAKGNYGSSEFCALHRAARRGDLDTACTLASEGYDVNAIDSDGYTPLMLAARGGHGKVCELLISYGARCNIKNSRGETALLLARKNGIQNDAEQVILEKLARTLVLSGALVKKHTKGGRGTPHWKVLNMVEASGVLRWGKSSKRNVVCRGAEVGASSAFCWNRRKKIDAEEPGVFRVVTTKNKEIHFVCEGGDEMAQLWVTGIKLVTREAIFGKKLEDS